MTIIYVVDIIMHILEPLEPEDRWGIEFKCYIGPPVPASPHQLTLLTKLCDGMNRQMQAGLSISDTPETIAIGKFLNFWNPWVIFAWIVHSNNKTDKFTKKKKSQLRC